MEKIMAAQVTEVLNKLSERQGTIHEESDLRVYHEAREMWVLNQAIRESEAKKEGYIEGFITGWIEGYIFGYLKNLVTEIIEGEVPWLNDLNRDIVIFMSKQGTEIELIENLTGFSPEEIRDIIKKDDDCTEILTRLVDSFEI